MSINFLKRFLSMQQLCGFACRLIYRTTFICCIFKTCLRPVRRLLASFVHFFNKNFYAADGDKWLCPRDSASSGYFFTHHDCCSLNMSDVDGSDAMQSQIWKRVVSFKRKLLGGSSVLPSSILEVVTRKSQNILSLQSNSAQMPNYVSSCSKRPKLELKHSAMTPDNTVVTIPEDFEPGPRSNATQECCMSSESLDSVSLLFGDELVALFDSDNQKKTGTCASASSGKKQKKKRKFSKKAEDKILRPNYFVAIQITNTDICQRVSEIQESMLKQNKLLKPAMIALPTLHLTLLVMHIADDLQLDRAKVALDACCQAVTESSVKLPTLCISGIDHFQNAIVFAKVQPDEDFDQLVLIANLATDQFKKLDLLSAYSDSKAFHPHLTIMKLSKAPRLRKQGIKKIDKSVYAEHSETLFGRQPVTNLQLCSMNAPKNKDTGYYKILHQVQLQSASVDDSSNN